MIRVGSVEGSVTNAEVAQIKMLREFVIRLVAKHPTLTLAEISAGLGLVNGLGHSVGDRRFTPIGRELEGNHQETFWGYSKRFEDTRNFFDCALEVVSPLENRRPFIQDFLDSNGHLLLCIDLFEGANVGDVLRPDGLALFSRLGIALGVELFE
jgi:hypothetical protein